MNQITFSERKLSKLIADWLSIIIFCLLVLGPIFLLFTNTIQYIFWNQIDWLSLIFPTSRSSILFINSLLQSLSVAILSMTIGWLCALLLWVQRSKYAWILVWFAVPLIAVPIYLHALSWFGITGALQTFWITFGSFGYLFQRWGVNIWVQALAYSPLALGFAWLGLRGIDPDLIEIGRISRSDLTIIQRICLPICKPALWAGGGIIFLLSLLDYSVPSLFQVHGYAMEIFAEFSASNSPERTFVVALPLLLIACLVILAILKPLRYLAVRVSFHNAAWKTPPSWPAWFQWLLFTAGALITLQAILPIFTLFSTSGGLSGIADSFQQGKNEFILSLSTAGTSTLFSVLLALVTARLLVSPGKMQGFYWSLVAIPLALPAALMGIGFAQIATYTNINTSILNSFLPALVCLARFAPFAVIILAAQKLRADPLLEEAGLVFQENPWRRFFQINLPMIIPGLLAGGGLVFALSMGEFAATLMVIPPGMSTLSMRIYNYLHYGASDTVAGLCLILMLGVILSNFVAGFCLMFWWRNFTPRIQKNDLNP